MTARAMFMTQPAHLMEAARSLGETRWGAFGAWPCLWRDRRWSWA